MLKQVFGEATGLGSDKLKSLLLVVMRNVTTDSPWPVTNNPRTKYNIRSRPDCNLDLPLWQLGAGLDGGADLFPARGRADRRTAIRFRRRRRDATTCTFVMYRNAVAPPFKLEWETGERKMLIISIGTGSTPQLGPDASHPSRSVFEVAMGSLAN